MPTKEVKCLTRILSKIKTGFFSVSIKSMIPENHICFFVEEFVESLNFSDFDLRFDGARIEINIVSICHNLKKIWKYRRGFKENINENGRLVICFVRINLIVGQRQYFQPQNQANFLV